MATIKAGDVISGKLAKAYLTIDGSVREMFWAKNIEASVKKKKTEVPVLGQTGLKFKSSGWSGSGKMTIYYSTTLFRSIMLDYIKTGRDKYFDITVENDDPASQIGRQTVVLRSVNLNSACMAKLDVGAELLDETVDFTFHDVDILGSFSDVVPE
jgi:hypothetical protein